jgi:hypothetical protein
MVGCFITQASLTIAVADVIHSMVGCFITQASLTIAVADAELTKLKGIRRKVRNKASARRSREQEQVRSVTDLNTNHLWTIVLGNLEVDNGYLKGRAWLAAAAAIIVYLV